MKAFLKLIFFVFCISSLFSKSFLTKDPSCRGFSVSGGGAYKLFTSKPISDEEILNQIKKSFDETSFFQGIKWDELNKIPMLEKSVEKSFLFSEQGDYFKSLLEIRKAISLSWQFQRDIFSDKFYILSSDIYSSLGLYNLAKNKLEIAASKNKNDPTIDFKLSEIYFQLGLFEKAKNQYEKIEPNTISSYKINNKIDPFDKNSLDFAKGIIEGIQKGNEKCIEPAILYSKYGLETGVILKQIEYQDFPKDVVIASRKCIKNMFKMISYDKFVILHPILQNLLYYFYEFSDFEFGYEFGYLIGKCGIDILDVSPCFYFTEKLETLKNSISIFSLKKLSEDSEHVKEIANQWNLTHQELVNKLKNGNNCLKKFINMDFSENYTRKLLHIASIETFKKPKKLPKYFRLRFSSQDGNMKYINPKNKKEYVVVIPPDINSSIIARLKPHVLHRRGKYAVIADGELISRKSDDAYIPLEDFIFHPKKK